MKLKNVKTVGYVLMLVGFVLLMVALFVDPSLKPYFGFTGLGFALISRVFFAVLWKCNHCNYRLPIRGMLAMKRCPYCGKDFDTVE